MKNLLKFSALAYFLFLSLTPKAQVLISILLGDKLNTPKIEFGMVGGMNRSYLNDISGSSGLNHFNLGFYFHINMKNNSYLSTGVTVKSNVGATGMPVYSIGNDDFDSIYEDGTLTKKDQLFLPACNVSLSV